MPESPVMSANAPNITLDLLEHARHQPNKAALVMHDGPLSYQKLDQLTWRAMQHLHNQGLRAGDVVALTLQSELLLALAMLGAIRLGATVLPIPRSTTAFLRSQWEQLAQASWWVTDGLGPMQTGCARASLTWDALQGLGPIDHGLLCEKPSDLLSIAVGSGSTGQPKLMPLTHGQMRGRFQSATRVPLYHPETRLLRLPSLEYASSQTFFLSMLHLGATYFSIACPSRNIPALCARHGINTLGLSVFHAENLLQHTNQDTRALTSAIKIQIGGSTVSELLRSALRTHVSEHVHVTYGTNECLFVSMIRQPLGSQEPGNVGQPIEGVAVEVVDENYRPANVGEAGLIRLKSPGLISGYLNNEEQTAKSFKDGWFYPGDVGRLTADGHLVHLGRADWMMIFNGINIYPAEIEGCMITHSGVKDVVAFPIKHPVHQDIPACAVVLKDGANVSDTELMAHARELLGFRAPKQIFVISEVPRNELGKVVRPALFRMIAPV